ncbi:ubiquitin carboxyl-terminal hydrolase 36-like [Frankliniella occidentalis]|uniref:Ubiquitin carboxyl-terminal hydrolase 36 n=1 Tax=Frankliniella occidentalis TaxID=133901 RepID=A0A9C6X0B5_FRAOC|nr:ubiquitin carboxyl-terminal hydrolase 36-like [Frankliniella occidentalis]
MFCVIVFGPLIFCCNVVSLHISGTCENMNCAYVSETYSPFTYITLNLNGVSTVQAAVNKYFEPECQEFKCSACRQVGKTNSKQFEIHEAANTIFIVLLRFRSNGSKIDSRVSLDDIVSFPDGTKYQLAGAVMHLGSQSKSGHYTAVTKCTDQSFREFDDKFVSNTNCITSNEI